MKEISGGVCAAKGFTAAGLSCGIRKKGKKDLAFIVSEARAAAACCYTQNLVKGAPLLVTKDHLSDGYARAIICNSGNANTCNADGIEVADGMCALVEECFGIFANDVVVASTGVIGQPLSIEPFIQGVPLLLDALGKNSSDATEAIMTTDTVKKECAFEFSLGDTTCHIGGIAKGSGMIAPNMATMLAFITTDANISPAMLQRALGEDIKRSFNLVSVDGDTSTNDMVCLLANGLAGNPEVTVEGANFEAFCAALATVTQRLSRMIAKDGEGATKLIECIVTGAKSENAAEKIARAVINSSLVKTAIFGADANWGRVLCAIGYSGADVDIDAVGVSFSSSAGSVTVCENGRGVPFSEEEAKNVLLRDEIIITIALRDGDGEAVAYGCDLSYDYVKINGDYRT